MAPPGLFINWVLVAVPIETNPLILLSRLYSDLARKEYNYE